MTAAVAVINWNSGHLLRACIESLLATAGGSEILVIDNASIDDSLESVQGYRNKVNFIRNSVNRGFAAAVNQAFQSTDTTYVLVLNPDIRVLPGSISILEEFMEAHPMAGAIGGYVNEKYLPRDLPTAASIVRENLGLGRRSGLPAAGRTQTVRVEQPAAAALMIRREAFEAVGGFDEQFFPAWYEDVDFCRRLKTSGWEVYFAPQAEFLHEGGYSANSLGAGAFTTAYYTNQLRYARKHLGVAGQTAIRASIATGMIGRIVRHPKHAGTYARTILGALGKWR